MTYDDIECALLFVSSGAPFEHRAVIQRSTGEIFYASEITDENEIPDEVDEDEGGCYLSIPHKHDLELGRPLVMEFVQGRCPEQIDRVRAIFSRQGAYRRYKDFLAEKALLEAWYAFENARTKEVLLQWCEENGIVLEEEPESIPPS